MSLMTEVESWPAVTPSYVTLAALTIMIHQVMACSTARTPLSTTQPALAHAAAPVLDHSA